MTRKNSALQVTASFSRSDLTSSDISSLNRLIKKTQLENPDPADLQALRQMLETHPDLWRALGDLADLSTHAVLGFGSWLNPGMRLAAEIGTREIKKELGYAQASALERLLIDQIVVTWLQLGKTQIKYESSLSAGASFQTSDYWERRLSASSVRHVRAIETLARVRRLARPGAVQVNIGAQQVNLATSSDDQTMADQSIDLSDAERTIQNDLVPE